MKSGAIFVFCLMVLSACGPTIAKTEPGSVSGERATVYFYSQGVELSAMSVDGTEQGLFEMGIRVPAGHHRARAIYKGKDQDCTELIGCLNLIHEGECRAELDVEAGQSYAIRVSGHASVLIVDVRRKSDNARVGGGSCQPTDVHRDWTSRR